jgi:hypothetical protein
LVSPSRKREATMGPNSRTLKLRSFLMNRASSMSFQAHTPLNKMV